MKGVTRKVWVLAFLLIIFGCKKPQELKFEQIVNTQIEKENLFVRACQPSDTIFRDSFFIRYECINEIEGEFILFWGNDKFTRAFSDTFSCISNRGIDCDYLPYVELVDKDYIYLKRGTDGSSAMNCEPIFFEQIILPKDITSVPVRNFLFIKLEDSISIASNGYDKIYATHHLKQLEWEFELNPTPTKLFRTLQASFDTLYISNGALYVNYFVEENDEISIVKKKFKLAQ